MSAKLKYATILVVTLALVGGIVTHDIITMKPKAETVEAAPVAETQQPKPTVVAEAEPVVNEPEPEPEPVAPSWHYYNLDLQNNGTTDDDFNFGPPPQVTDANNLDQELRSRMREDPVLGAAVMAWADAVLGTRYLGVFFSECDEEWDAAINKAKESWVFDKESYNGTLETFFRHLDKAEVSVREEKKGLSDQMYMNPDTIDGIPDVIILETDDHSGKFLVYTFTIKGKKQEIKYRLDCGFQPTNVAEVMKVTPKQKVVRTGGKVAFVGGFKPVISGGGGKPGGSDPDPTPTPTPKPKPTPPTPKPIKDPTKGTPVLPNDDPGPGPNTNTGPGGQYSSKDLPGNSNDLTPEEYKKIIEDLQKANEGQKEGGDPNTPSTPTPADTTPDNNGDSGTGNGGIDQPTPVQEGTVGDDAPGEAWDGPPDA